MKKRYSKKDWARWNEENPPTFHLLAVRLYKILECDEGANEGRIKAAWHTLDGARERIEGQLREIHLDIAGYKYDPDDPVELYYRIESHLGTIKDIIQMQL